MWLHDTPSNLMIINALYFIDKITIEELLQAYSERIISNKHYERFMLRPYCVGEEWYWEKSEFDLKRHIRLAFSEEPLRTKAALERYVAQMAAQPLPGDISPWVLSLVEDFEGGSAIIFRCHHCLADGIALIQLLFALMDAEPPAAALSEEVGTSSPSASPAQQRKRAVTNKPRPVNMGMQVATALAVGPYILARDLVAAEDHNPLHGPDPLGSKHVAWSEPCSLDTIKLIKSKLGATVNDVLVALLAGAFRRYFKLKGATKVKEVRASMPVNMRQSKSIPRMENKFTTITVAMPVSVDDPRERVLEVKRRMDAYKTSVVPLVYYLAVQLLLSMLPTFISNALTEAYANKATCVLTNVPGPSEPVSISKRKVRQLMFWVPQKARNCVGISILSYANTVRIGVIADSVVCEEPMELINGFMAELEQLKALVSQ
eukprot:Colp12_sorted_trinity150504_noHs@4015